MEQEEKLWDASIEQLTKGYVETEAIYQCVVCQASYEKGRIYSKENNLYDAYGAVNAHLKEAHGSMLDYLLTCSSNLLGVSEIQKQVIEKMAAGASDKEIGSQLGIATSTVRNHRFKIREKEKQAKLFLATMQLLSEKTHKAINETDEGLMCEPHRTATIVDDRYHITEKERLTTLKTYMDETGAIVTYPAKAKKKIIVLTEVAKNFVVGRSYTEKEVNLILQRIYSDYVGIRRALIEYGFFDRAEDGSSYRLKE